MGALAFVGDFGSAKTARMTKWLEEGRLDGYEVCSNYGYSNGRTFSTLSELAGILADHENIPYRERPWLRVGIDEAGVLFPCRGASKFPPILDLICNTARHFKVEIAYCIPNLSRVDVNLRLATSRVIRCRGWWWRWVEHELYGRIKSPRLLTWSEHSYADDKYQDKIGAGWSGFRKIEPFLDMYDSFFMSAAAASELRRICGMKDSDEMSWGAAEGPTATVVQIQQPARSGGVLGAAGARR